MAAGAAGETGGASPGGGCTGLLAPGAGTGAADFWPAAGGGSAAAYGKAGDFGGGEKCPPHYASLTEGQSGNLASPHPAS